MQIAFEANVSLPRPIAVYENILVMRIYWRKWNTSANLSSNRKRKSGLAENL